MNPKIVIPVMFAAGVAVGLAAAPFVKVPLPGFLSDAAMSRKAAVKARAAGPAAPKTIAPLNAVTIAAALQEVRREVADVEAKIAHGRARVVWAGNTVNILRGRGVDERSQELADAQDELRKRTDLGEALREQLARLHAVRQRLETSWEQLSAEEERAEMLPTNSEAMRQAHQALTVFEVLRGGVDGGPLIPDEAWRRVAPPSSSSSPASSSPRPSAPSAASSDASAGFHRTAERDGGATSGASAKLRRGTSRADAPGAATDHLVD